MKVKQLIAVAAATMVAVGLYAQGTVTFANGTTTRVTYHNTGGAIPPGFVNDQALFASNGVVFALYGVVGTNNINSVSPGAVADALSLVGATTTVSGVPGGGVFSGGSRTFGNSADYAIVQVRAWSSVGGTVTSYEQSVARGNANEVNGYSIPIFIQLGGGALPVPGIVAGGLTPLSPFFVTNPVPEPSVVALGVLGLLGVLFIRRRK